MHGDQLARRVLLSFVPVLTALVALAGVGLLLALGSAPRPVAAAPAQVILQNGFEDNTLQFWGPRGTTGVTVTAAAAATGNYSLLATGRTATWHGPSRSVLGLLAPGATYQISVSVRLAPGEAANDLYLTMQRVTRAVTPTTAYTRIATAAAAVVTDTAWSTMGGTYTFNTDDTTLNLYVESANATASYYIDDVIIVMTAAPASGVVSTSNFEDGTSQFWVARGGTPTHTVTVTDTVAVGTYSLLSSGRSATWHGPSRPVLGLLAPNFTYQISASVRLAAGQPASQIKLSMARTPLGGQETYDPIATGAAGVVTDTAWTTLGGTYVYTGEVSGLNLYAESAAATLAFYIDNIVITIAGAPEVETIRFYDFEDNTTQGWVARGGAPTHTVEVTTTVAISNYSLLSSGRSGGWHGPSVDVLSLLQPNVAYEIGGCVRLMAGQAITGTRARISMQQTIDGATRYPWIVSSGEYEVTETGWTCLTGSYSFTSTATALTLYVESPHATAAYYIDNIFINRLAQPPIQMDIPSVYQTLAPYAFTVGAAVEDDQLDDLRHVQLLTRHFNSLTPENDMKPGPIHPADGTYNWAPADKLANFARANGMFLHGHTLVWHQQAADWMFQDGAGNALTATVENKVLVLQRLTDHITAVAGRYQDIVNVWDVVNEVIDPAQTDCLRRSEWYRLTGPDYITTAFQVAHSVAPTATLIINDYGTTDPVKRACLYQVVNTLQAAGVPVDGIGHQMHINIENPSAASIAETLEYFKPLGLKQYVTELDMSVYTSDSGSYTAVPQEILVRQGYRYKDIFNVFRSLSQTVYLDSVTFWGMADDHTWLKNRSNPRLDLPLLFDEQLQAKYAYWGVIDASRLPVYTKQLNVTQYTPSLDGQSEFLWEVLPAVALGANDTLTASYQVRWDPSRLYLLVNVDDATQDVTDTVDIFIDQNNGKTSAYQADDRHYTYANGIVSPAAGVAFSTTARAGGYLLEIALPFSGTVAAGNLIGFDLRVTDGSEPAYPLAWNDPTFSQATDPSKFGTLTLIEAMRVTDAQPGVPVVDGFADTAWTAAEEIVADVRVTGVTSATARIKTLWDAGHLYVYAVVSDTLLSDASSNAWEEDSIEVFVDQNNAKTTSYQSDDGQYRVNYKNVASFGGGASAATLTSAARVISGGYIVELAITLTAVSPADGRVIGFDFQVNNDQDGNGSRDGVTMWKDPTGQSYQNTSRLGALRFVGTAPGDFLNLYLPIIAR